MEKICLLIESNMGEIPLCMPSWLYSCFYEKTAHRHHGTFVCFFLWMGTRKHRTHTLKGNTYSGPSSLADVRSTCTQQTLNSRRLTMCSSIHGLLVVLCLSELLSALPPILHRPVTTAGLAACGNPPAGHSGPAHRRCGGPAPYPRAPAGLGAAEGWGWSAVAGVR